MNLFIVETPFQYICANEARIKYKTTHNILLLVNPDSEPGISQQKKTVKMDDWDFVISIPCTNRSKHIPKAINTIKKIIKAGVLEYFFYAKYINWNTKLLLCNLPIHTEVYFDDGTLTINEYEESIRTRKVYERKRFIQDFLIRLRGCKPIGRVEQSKNLEIFTIFDLDNPEHKIVKNELSALKNLYGTPNLFDVSAPIGIIGRGAVGHEGHISVKQYLIGIEALKRRFNQDIIYFPHRTESQAIMQKIKQLGGITYHHSELPLEIELIDKSIHLSALIGMNSTAQYTALLLYPGIPIWNLIDEEAIQEYSSKNKQISNRICHLYQKAGIKKLYFDLSK